MESGRGCMSIGDIRVDEIEAVWVGVFGRGDGMFMYMDWL